MGFVELFILAIGLSMDAFSVSVCKGLSVTKIKIKHVLTVGLYFGGFQALMPLLGYWLGYKFQFLITNFDHWVVFGLLLLIGANMIRESFSNEEEKSYDSFNFTAMFPLAIATSIDALAVGITLALLPDVNIIAAICFIGIITFVFSWIGLLLGKVVGAKFKSKAEFAGGLVLILIGLKILLEHLEIISF